MADVHAGRLTVADLDALPDVPGTRYELFDGELFVSTQPHHEHQAVTMNIGAELVMWSRAMGSGRVFGAPGIVFDIYDAAVPDVAWASHARLAQIADDEPPLHGAPELAVEVLSPGSRNQQRDRAIKLATYSRYGVQEYWIVDRWQRTVAIYRHDGTALQPVGTLGADDTLTSPILPGFSVRVAAFFD
jgi:Uma2 family endonuclease